MRGCYRKETAGVFCGPGVGRKAGAGTVGSGMSGNTSQDIAAMSFEDALAELEGIVRRLEDGTANLEDAITAYERGVALQRHCDSKLQEAQSRVERIVVGRNGAVSAEPVSFD